MTIFIALFYILIAILTFVLYAIFVSYFSKLTKHNNIDFGKIGNYLYMTFFVMIFLIFIIIGFICSETDFLLVKSKKEAFTFYYIHFLFFFVISYYYCYISNYIFKVIGTKNQTLISILGFLPIFILSCIFLGIIVGIWFK